LNIKSVDPFSAPLKLDKERIFRKKLDLEFKDAEH
jgi:hypothetical protein